MRNQTNISIEDLTNNYYISIQGNSKTPSVKNGYTEKKLISGKTRTSNTNTGKYVIINIEKLSQVEYDKLLTTWEESNTVLVETERNESILGIITGDTFDLDSDENTDAETFYFGTIEIRE